jgi:electron transfer flavoprotein alpha subunit
MAGMWVLGEVTADGTLARISTEVATLARTLAEASSQEVAGVVVAADPTAAATELATYLPRVLAVSEPAAADRPWSMVAAERIAGLLEPDTKEFMFVGAGPDGRDVAGALSATLGWGVLANALGAAWADGGPVVEMSVFGGKLTTTSRFTGPTGIVTVRPNVVTAAPSKAAGSVEVVEAVGGDLRQPAVRVAERVVEAGTAAPIEEARVIVAGGRGVGGPDGFKLVEQIAEALGGAVGATRAAVDAGWIPYGQQIGQTGKIVKPQLYLALGISGAIQHKVGMQTAETIVAVNRDPDAPIADFADLVVIGDLFEVGPALLSELRARQGSG